MCVSEGERRRKKETGKNREYDEQRETIEILRGNDIFAVANLGLRNE